MRNDEMTGQDRTGQDMTDTRTQPFKVKDRQGLGDMIKFQMFKSDVTF